MSKDLPIVAEPRRQTISRREIAKTLLGGFTAGLWPPGLSLLHKHLLNDALLHHADHALAVEPYQPAILSPAQLASLIVLSEAIIPGSRKAQSAEFIDLLLSVDDVKARQQFVESLAAMETSSEAKFHQEVVALSPPELQQLLEAESAKGRGERSPFGNLKSWAVTAYYSSEIGLRELGWTPDRVFPSYPVCTHAESHS